MRRTLSSLIIILLLVFTLPVDVGAYGMSSYTDSGVLNEWITATSPTSQFDWSGYGQAWKDSFDFSYAPYMKVYKISVEPGAEYTLYMKMPIEQGYMNIDVTGLNPESDTFDYVDGTISGFVMYFQQPWAPRSNNLDAYRKNFKIASSSESSDLYLICSFENPGKSFEFMIKSPKDSDDDVSNSTLNPFVPDRNGYTWGGLMETPVWLAGSSYTMGNETYHEEETYTEPVYTEPTYGNETYDDYNTYVEPEITTFTSSDAAQKQLGQEYEYMTALEVDTLVLKEMYLDDWATAYQLYKFQVEPGQKYTFDFLYNTFNNINTFLIGEDPMTSLPFNNSAGSNTIIAAFQEQPFLSLGYDEWYASRTQFMTSSDSTGTTLYVLIRGYYEGEPYKFRLSKGYLSTEEETYNPYADSLNGYKWVSQWNTPLKIWQ